MKNTIYLLLVASWLLVFPANSHADSVVNGGFETGDFTGWTWSGPDLSHFDVEVRDAATAGQYIAYQGGPFSGVYSAYLGPDPAGSLSQNVSTLGGQTYLFSFALGNFVCNPSATCPQGTSSFDALLNGVSMFSLSSAPPSSGFTVYAIPFLATGTTTTIRFDVLNDSAYWALDNVSIVAAPAPVPALAPEPEPSSLLLLGFGLPVMACACRRRLSCLR